MTQSDTFKMVAIADLHFGNPRVPAEELYKKLRQVLYPELKNAHLIVVCGDLYDQLLTVSSKAHKFASMFISDLFRISAHYGLTVRLLHGTYTHDRDQLDIFHTLKIPNARYKIINNIEVEQIDGFVADGQPLDMKLRIGYLPDNLSFKESGDAVDHLKKQMTCCCFPVLDCVIGHGSFDHAIPPESGHKPPCLYYASQFEKLIPRGPVVMGHIHTPSRTGKIFYCGSFDRLAHGEEHEKGFYVFTREVTNENGWRHRFVANQLSTNFTSIYPEGEDAADISRNFTQQVNQYFPSKFGYVRVVHKSADIRHLLHRVCTTQFPTLVYTSKSTGEKEKSTFKVEDISLDIFEDVVPNALNLGDLVFKFLEENKVSEGVVKEEIIERTKLLIDSR